MPARSRLTPSAPGSFDETRSTWIGAFERVEQRRRVVVGAAPYAHAAIGEVLCFRDVAHAHPDLVRGDALEQVLDGGAVEGTRGAGDDDHAAAAVTLRAALPDLTALTAAERALLGDWLDRIADTQRVPG
jgi:hypothetical protein